MSVNHAYSAFSAIGIVLVLIPLPLHLRCKNIGTISISIWTAVALLINFVNSIVWDGSALDVATVWCEITTRILLGAGIAIPAGTLCIVRQLYSIATVSAITRNKARQQRAFVIDFFIALGLPVANMALYYVIQGNRYNILEDYGCTPVVINTPVAWLLQQLWPLVIGVISLIYGCLAMRAFLQRRHEFQEHAGMFDDQHTNRYTRLILLSVVDISTTIPLSTFYFYLCVVDGWSSYNWDDVHYGFDRVDTFPSVLWKGQGPNSSAAELSRWVYVIVSIMFFAFFGICGENWQYYRPFLIKIAPCLASRCSDTQELDLTFHVHRPQTEDHSFASVTIPGGPPGLNFMHQQDCSEKTILSDIKQGASQPPSPPKPPASPLPRS